MGLMKPSGRLERAIDTLQVAHRHKHTEATRESIGDGGVELWWNFFVITLYLIHTRPAVFRELDFVFRC